MNIFCWLIGHHVPYKLPDRTKKLYGKFDAYDDLGRCERCKSICHRDMHIYGDSKWRKL